MIDKYSALTEGDIEKDLMTLQYHNMSYDIQLLKIHRHVINMDEEIKDHERIAKQIAKTSDSIRKNYRALKADKMEEDIALERL